MKYRQLSQLLDGAFQLIASELSHATLELTGPGGFDLQRADLDPDAHPTLLLSWSYLVQLKHRKDEHRFVQPGDLRKARIRIYWRLLSSSVKDGVTDELVYLMLHRKSVRLSLTLVKLLMKTKLLRDERVNARSNMQLSQVDASCQHS